MADVYIVVYTLIGILITLPALLVALNLVFPKVTTRTAKRLTYTPFKSFFMGLPVVAFLSLWIAITSQTPIGFLRGTAFAAALFGMGLGTLGAAGMARSLGDRLSALVDPASEMMNLLRGAVVYELACLFPIANLDGDQNSHYDQHDLSKSVCQIGPQLAGEKKRLS